MALLPGLSPAPAVVVELAAIFAGKRTEIDSMVVHPKRMESDYALPAEAILQAAVEYATTLAERCSPAAMATIKAQLRRDASTSFDTARDDAFKMMLAAFEHPDQREGAAAFQERRLPSFAPLPTVG